MKKSFPDSLSLSGCWPAVRQSLEPGAGMSSTRPSRAGWTNVKFLISGIGDTILISVIARGDLHRPSGLIVALPGLSSRNWQAGVRSTGSTSNSFAPSRLLPMLFWVFYGSADRVPVDGPEHSDRSRSGGQSSHWRFRTARLRLKSIARAFSPIAKGQTRSGANHRAETTVQTMRYVILPQAIRRILPPLANQFIYIVKMSAFASGHRDAGTDPPRE